MSNKLPLRVLITRPEPQASELMNMLAAEQITAHKFSLFEYQQAGNIPQLESLLSAPTKRTIIFVSPAAVKFAQQLVDIRHWPHQQIIAVGVSTQKALKQFGVTALCPEQFNSEGILAMPELDNAENILIVRGDNGRELLADSLTKQGKQVGYFTAYRKVWFNHDPSNTSDQLKKWQINCIVSTSNALLNKMIELLAHTNDQWRNEINWLVVSERMLTFAKQHKIAKVININGASNSQITQALKSIG